MVKNFISRHPDFVLQSGDTLLPGELSDGASAFLLRRFFSR
jgi:hypothetical protein